MTSCTCDFGFISRPAARAAGLLHLMQARASGKKRGGEDGTIRDVLGVLSCRLQGSGPVLFEFARWSEQLDVTVVRLREVVAWLAEHEFLALDGDVDGVARVWVNPSVAFSPGADLRAVAARHRFPYIMAADLGAAAERPVIVHPYDADAWDEVYQGTLHMAEEPFCFSSEGCGLHER
ncbi:hypothetical protein PL81_21805 [Streptomyces sp. RSD-27]|nr:hypothetical protein PL81_21805 [Streptomyces sp. RSD-27]